MSNTNKVKHKILGILASGKELSTQDLRYELGVNYTPSYAVSSLKKKGYIRKTKVRGLKSNVWMITDKGRQVYQNEEEKRTKNKQLWDDSVDKVKKKAKSMYRYVKDNL